MGDDIFLVPLDSHIATLALLIDRLAFSLLTLPPSSKSQLPAYNQSPQLCGVSYPCHPGASPSPSQASKERADTALGRPGGQHGVPTGLRGKAKIFQYLSTVGFSSEMAS